MTSVQWRLCSGVFAEASVQWRLCSGDVQWCLQHVRHNDLSFSVGKLKTFRRKTQIQMLPPTTLHSVRFSLELPETHYRVSLRYSNTSWYKLFVVVAAMVILWSLDRTSGLWGDQQGAPTSLLWICNPRIEGGINFECCIFEHYQRPYHHQPWQNSSLYCRLNTSSAFDYQT